MRMSHRLLAAGVGGALVAVCVIAWLQHPQGGSDFEPSLPLRTVPQLESPPAPPVFARTFPSLPDQRREFRRLDPEAESLRQTLTHQLWQATDDAARLSLLDRLEAECYSADLIELVRAALSTQGWGEAARLRSVDLLAGNLDPAILSALLLARRAPEEDLRAASLLAAAHVGSGFTEFALPALGDSSSAVRLMVLEAAVEQSDAVQARLRTAALGGRHADVALQAAGELLVEASSATLPSLFTGLDAPLPEVREQTRQALDFLFDQPFTSTAAAAAWWSVNRHRYNEDLVLRNP